MTLPEGYWVRPATRDDALSVTEMFIEVETGFNGEPESTVEDLYDDWSLPGFDIERDTWTIWHGDELVGYVGVVKHTPPDIYTAYGGVRLSHMGRGLGSFLFEATERRAAEKAGGPASLRQWIDARDKVAIALLEKRGYSFVRRFRRMDIALEDDLPGPRPVEGVEIRSFEKGRDERAAHEVDQASFAQHWGFAPRTYEEAAKSRWEADWFDPGMSLVAEADGEMVAICINSRRVDDGFVDDIGVLPNWRGRGIAEALLRRSFAIFKERGLARASLNVDTDNSSGAVRLYERVGMHTGSGYDVYERRVGT